MSSQRLVKYRVFVAWADQKEEQWLEQMAASGWHLVSGGIRFVFERGEPRQMRYRLDYRPTYPQGQDEYFAIFRDAGWEHAGDYFGWHYFRSPVSANAPEVFTDMESRVSKYSTLLAFVAVVTLANLLIMPGLIQRGLSEHMSGLGRVVIPLQACMAALLFYATVRLTIHIWQIRHPRGAR